MQLITCPDCGVTPGNIHEENCAIQRCSSCGGQLLSCDCQDFDLSFSRWTGFYPGTLEAKELGINLNKFYEQGYHKIFFVKPKEKGTFVYRTDDKAAGLHSIGLS